MQDEMQSDLVLPLFPRISHYSSRGSFFPELTDQELLEWRPGHAQ